MIRIITLLLLLLSVHSVHAAQLSDFERKVALDWDPLTDAQTYDIEIGRFGKAKAVRNENSVPTNRWTGLLAPGRYWMRVRGRDERNVAGDWSDKSEILIKLPKVDVVMPAPETVVNTSEKSYEMTFEWKLIGGAKVYAFSLESESHQTLVTRKLTDSSIKLVLPSSEKYKWSIVALDEEDRSGDLEEFPSALTIQGASLLPPVITKPENYFVRKIEFERPPEASGVRIQLDHFDSKKNSWVREKEWLETRKFFPFSGKWPGGRYQVTMRTEGHYRASSSASEMTFDVFDGPRTADREDQALARKALNRAESWYAQASYVSTYLSYKGTNYESDSRPAFSALTGNLSGTLGRFAPNSPWGINFGGSFGTVSLDGKNTILIGEQALALYRREFGERSEIRLAAGLAHRELPEARLQADQATFQIDKVTTTGVKVGSEYWYAFNRKVGLQGHAFYTQNIFGSDASGAALSSGTSIELGVLGSYRWRPDITWLAGYTFARDTFTAPGTDAVTQRSGTDEVNLTGHYLHLMVEYDF